MCGRMLFTSPTTAVSWRNNPNGIGTMVLTHMVHGNGTRTYKDYLLYGLKVEND